MIVVAVDSILHHQAAPDSNDRSISVDLLLVARRRVSHSNSSTRLGSSQLCSDKLNVAAAQLQLLSIPENADG